MKLNKTALIATTVTAATVALAGCKMGGNSNDKTMNGATNGNDTSMQHMTPATKTGCCAGKMQDETKKGCCAAKKMGCSAKTSYTTKHATFASAAKQWGTNTADNMKNSSTDMSNGSEQDVDNGSMHHDMNGSSANDMSNNSEMNEVDNGHGATTPSQNDGSCAAAQQ